MTTLRTDLTNAEAQTDTHPSQHNEVNAIVLKLPPVLRSATPPIETIDGIPFTLLTADLSPASGTDVIWAVRATVLAVHDANDDVATFTVNATIATYATPEAPTTWTGRVVGTPDVTHIFDASMETVTAVELTMDATTLSVVGTGQSDTLVYWTATLEVVASQSIPADDS